MNISIFRGWGSRLLAPIAAAILIGTALPRAAHAGPPIGINTGFVNDYSGPWFFADAQMQARNWSSISGTLSVDSNGWPTQDAKDGLWFGAVNNMAGTYGLSFVGQATVTVSFGTGTVSSLVYNSGTNTTTGTVQVTNPDAFELTFTNTKRTSGSATNTGVTNVKMMRPTVEGGSTPIATNVLFYPPYMTLLSNFSTIRFQGYGSIWGNNTSNWTDRVRPAWTTQQVWLADGTEVGGAWEYAVMMCNQASKDMYLNTPHRATDDYITKLAQLIKYGSDGTNPYTSVQANPVYPPLNASLNCYVEWGNEVWNFGPQDDATDNNNAVPIEVAAYPVVNGVHVGPLTFDGGTGNGMCRVAKRAVEVSNIFRSVFGDSAMPGTSSNPRIRPLLETQFDYADNSFLSGCHMLEDYYNNPAKLAAYPGPITVAHPPSYYLYGSGGSDYYTPGTGVDINSIWTSNEFNIPTEASILLMNTVYALPVVGRRIAYEGGPDMPACSCGDDAVRNAAWGDSRMTTEVQNQETSWQQNGGGLLMYLADVGDFQWGFVHDLAVQNTPKMNAVTAINASTPVAGTVGTPIPSTIAASPYSSPPSWAGADPNNMVAAGSWTWIGYLANVGTAGAFNIGLSAGSSGTVNQADIYIDGTLAGTITIPNTGSNTTYASSATVATPSLAIGTHGILVKAKAGSFGFQSVQVSAGGTPTIPPAPTGLTATPSNNQITLNWGVSVGSTSYNVYRGTTAGGESGTAIATGIIPTSYTNTGLSNGTTYYYKVTAVNTAGESGKSGEASAAPLDNTAHAVQTATAPTIDGSVDALWSGAPSYTLGHVNSGSTTDTGSFQMLWDSTNLYVLATINDGVLFNDASVWNGDSVELYIDGDNNKSTSYDSNDFQYAFQYNNATATESKHSPGSLTGVVFAQGNISGGYRIEAKIPWSTIGVTPSANALIGTDVMLDDSDSAGTQNGKKAWWATANNTWSNPALMGTGTLVPSGGSAPAAPTGLTATAGNTQAALSWTASSGATSYNVLRSTVNGSGYASVATGISTTSYTNTGLTNGTTYYFVVTATNSFGTSGNSNQASATPSGGSTNLALNKTAATDSTQSGHPASSANDGNTTTRWTANDGSFPHWWSVDLGASDSLTSSSVMFEGAGVWKYKIDVSPDNTTWTTVIDKTGNTVSAQTFADTFTATARYVRITVTGSSGGFWASIFEMQVFGTAGGSAPPAPTGLTATAGNAQVALSWTASSGATSYNVLRSTVNGSGYASVATGVSTTAYTNTGLTNGTTYYFVVTATNSFGTSANSSQASAKPNAPVTIDDSVLGTGQNQFNYIGAGWGHCTNCGADLYNLSNSWDSTTNDNLTVAFTGTQIKFYSVKDTSDGICAVSIDGGTETNVDLYASARAGNVLVWTSAVLTSGSHTFKMRNTGTKNASSSGTTVLADRVDIVP